MMAAPGDIFLAVGSGLPWKFTPCHIITPIKIANEAAIRKVFRFKSFLTIIFLSPYLY
jgi:hypothetical protein